MYQNQIIGYINYSTGDSEKYYPNRKSLKKTKKSTHY